LFRGYWNDPERTSAKLRTIGGKRFYDTGDYVRLADERGYVFIGRRDRMVKRRGYRIELDEIECALYANDAVEAAAIISVVDPAGEARIIALVSPRPTGGLTILGLRRMLAGRIPSAMMPDILRFVDALPRTTTGKVDYQELARVALAGEASVAHHGDRG
jgi:acyl-coenzyme A synthetase/AMP-(fatty) acid ligase